MIRIALPLFLASALLGGGCAAPSSPPGSTDYRLAEDFDGRRPADVGVKAVEGVAPSRVASGVREELRERLLSRRFAPVRSAEVDRRPGDYRPGGSQAVLVVTVTTWDAERLWGDGSVRVTADARLHEAGTGALLYHAHIKDVTLRAPAPARSIEERPGVFDALASLLADRLLERLPVKGDG